MTAKPLHDDEKPKRRRAAKKAEGEAPASPLPRAKKAAKGEPGGPAKSAGPKREPKAKGKPAPAPELESASEAAEHRAAPKRRSRKPPPAEKVIIGWSEGVGFPDWGIRRIQAKVDTGADSSALHVENLEKLPGGKVRFEVIHNRRPPWRRRHVVAKAVKWARVRSSTGEFTTRCFVRTVARIGPVEKKIDISLVSREKMAFRMLLGRKALARDFLVDAATRSHLGSNGARRKKADEREPGSGEA